MSIPSAPRQNPTEYTWQLRRFFIVALVKHPTYEELCDAVLRPLWDRTREAHPELSDTREYDALPAPAEHDDPLNIYITALRRSVAETLRSRIGGAPAGWVCHAVHAGVAGGSVDAGMLIQHWIWLGHLTIEADSLGSALVISTINGRSVLEPDTFEPQSARPFTAWKKLRSATYRHVNALIEEMERTADHATETWQTRYAKGVNTRTLETMPKLVAWLVGHEKQFGKDRSAVYALLAELGLDPPVIRPKS